jgi:hypothetical protein
MCEQIVRRSIQLAKIKQSEPPLKTEYATAKTI